MCLVRLQTFRAFRSLPSLKDDGHIKDSIINCVEVKVGRTTQCPGCFCEASNYCRTKDCSICSMVLHYAIRTCFDYVILFWCSKRSRSEAFCGRRGRNGRSVMVFPSLRIYFGYLILFDSREKIGSSWVHVVRLQISPWSWKQWDTQAAWVSWCVKVMRFSAGREWLQVLRLHCKTGHVCHPYRQVLDGCGNVWFYQHDPTIYLRLSEKDAKENHPPAHLGRLGPRDGTFIRAVSGRTPRQVRRLKAQRSSWRTFSTLPCWSRKDDILILSSGNIDIVFSST